MSDEAIIDSRRNIGECIGSGLTAVLDSDREVSGFITENGILLVFKSHGIETPLGLSREAFSAAIGVIGELYNRETRGGS